MQVDLIDRKVKHKDYGKGKIIKICEPGRYHDCLVEFEKRNCLFLDDGNCVDTDFRAVGKSYQCKYCTYEELEIIDENKSIEKLGFIYINTYGNRSQHRASEKDIIDKINELIDILNKLKSEK